MSSLHAFHVFQAGLAMLMSRMYHEAPKEFKFYPETWVLPAEMNDFRCACVRTGREMTQAILCVRRCLGTGPLALAFRWQA